MEITLTQILRLDIEKFEQAITQFFNTPANFDDHCKKVNKLFKETKRSFIKNLLESADKQLCKSNFKCQT